MSLLLSALRDPDWVLGTTTTSESQVNEQLEDRRLSRSLLSGLLVLSCFPPDGTYLGIVDISRMLSTLMVAGLLERDPDLRKYRVVRIG